MKAYCPQIALRAIALCRRSLLEGGNLTMSRSRKGCVLRSLGVINAPLCNGQGESGQESLLLG